MKAFNKRISKSGSITLPASLRREYGLAEGEKFKILVDSEDGTILLQRTNGQCLFCESDQQLIVYMGRFVCAKCVENMDADVSERKSANAFVGQVSQS
ncbi:AbrB family transcriptional regulator [Geobacillus stearothermophilus 10]|nr:AbrB family transcriptional regulator [Geobacillus stearothermophilus 10]